MIAVIKYNMRRSAKSGVPFAAGTQTHTLTRAGDYSLGRRVSQSMRLKRILIWSSAIKRERAIMTIDALAAHFQPQVFAPRNTLGGRGH
jgi:hypothetical protein